MQFKIEENQYYLTVIAEKEFDSTTWLMPIEVKKHLIAHLQKELKPNEIVPSIIIDNVFINCQLSK